MAEEKVTVVNTDFNGKGSPVNQNGYVGVDPYFQGAPLSESAEDKKEDEQGKETVSPPSLLLPPKP